MKDGLDDSDELVGADFVASFEKSDFWSGVCGVVFGELEDKADCHGTLLELRHGR